MTKMDKKKEKEIVESLEGLHELNKEAINSVGNLFNLKI